MSEYKVHIRPAQESDAAAIMEMIHGLALFEKAPEKVELDVAIFQRDGFGPNPAYKAFVADVDGEIVGFSLSYVRYSTWRGRVCFVEDLFVKQAFRGRGIGRQLLNVQMEWATAEGMRYTCLQVLDWNQPAIQFYKQYPGVVFDPEWINVLLPNGVAPTDASPSRVPH